MRIQPLYPAYKTQQSNPNQKTFKAWNRTVYKFAKDNFTEELKHRNDTYFFRDGAFWNNLSCFLLNKYHNTPKVNVYNYACSDGSEPYTFLMSMISNYGVESVEKFVPIRAFDYDSKAIAKAKSMSYTIEPNEQKAIDELTFNQAETFFKYQDYGNSITARPKPILTTKVDFKVSNLLHDYKRIEPENSIVFARNFWPYLKEDAITLAKKLASRMGENSTLILGRFDTYGCEWFGIDIIKELVTRGFSQANDTGFVFNKNI